jgi:hypothetical protein
VARKTIRVSDQSGEEIPDGKGAVLSASESVRSSSLPPLRASLKVIRTTAAF